MTGVDVGKRGKTGMGVAAAGMLLIATTYGMARFGVGLFAPLLATERPALVEVLGWAAAAQFSSYSLAALAAARLVDQRPKAGLVIAGFAATVGCLGVALAADPIVFVVSVLAGGLGGGFASPALVPLIDAMVAPEAAATAQSMANAGTAVGVIGAGLVAFTANSSGPAWMFMALACAVSTLGAWYPVRKRSDLVSSRGLTSRPSLDRYLGVWRLLLLPGVGALIVGAGSSLVWTFGPLLMTGPGPVAPEQVGWLWIALGLGGLLGILTGALVARTGLHAGWGTCAGALACASAGLALSVMTGSSWLAYVIMGLFGAGYMGLSGVLILWARHAQPTDAGAGTSLLFVALATGQALGSVGFGIVQEGVSPAVLAALAAGLCTIGGLVPVVAKR